MIFKILTTRILYVYHMYTQVVLDLIRCWSPCIDFYSEADVAEQKITISKMLSRIVTYIFLSKLILERLH